MLILLVGAPQSTKELGWFFHFGSAVGKGIILAGWAVVEFLRLQYDKQLVDYNSVTCFYGSLRTSIRKADLSSQNHVQIATACLRLNLAHEQVYFLDWLYHSFLRLTGL